ncbi:hypothetical protein ACW4TU_41480 [Streptomyces sp. QTS52]
MNTVPPAAPLFDDQGNYTPSPGTVVKLLAMHTHAAGTGGQPKGCKCPRAACGGAESGPGIPWADCTAHGTITIRHHRAFDCPQLPADTDLSRLWLVVSTWTDDGPLLDHAAPFTRNRLRELRANSAMWDASLGDTLDDAVRTWQDRIDAMRAASARHQAAQVAEAQERARTREAAIAALRDSGVRTTGRMIAAPGDL